MSGDREVAGYVRLSRWLVDGSLANGWFWECSDKLSS